MDFKSNLTILELTSISYFSGWIPTILFDVPSDQFVGWMGFYILSWCHGVNQSERLWNYRCSALQWWKNPGRSQWERSSCWEGRRKSDSVWCEQGILEFGRRGSNGNWGLRAVILEDMCDLDFYFPYGRPPSSHFSLVAPAHVVCNTPSHVHCQGGQDPRRCKWSG